MLDRSNTFPVQGLIPVLALLSLGFSWTPADAHEVVVHRDISYNAVDILDIDLLNRHRAVIGQGAIDEDTFPQYCYHAYNPINSHGFDLPCPGVVSWANIIANNAHRAIPILWADTINLYNSGNLAGEGGAFHMLGRCIHLIQDVTSPAHVHSDMHIDGDDFEIWGPGNFVPLLNLTPAFPPGPDTAANFVHRAATLDYAKTTYPGIIREANPQLNSVFRRMFPTLTFHDGGFFGDDYWVINNIGDYDAAFDSVLEPCGIGTPTYCDEWWPSDDDYNETEPGGTRTIAGNFYIENSAGDNGNLTPARWNDTPNDRSLMRIYGDEMYPIAIRYSAGLLQVFLNTVCPPPTADFTMLANQPDCAPLQVGFHDRSEGGDIDSWRWNFGDGTISNLRNPTHSFTESGNYTVSLTVSGDCGEDSASENLLVEILPGAPVVDESGDRIEGECVVNQSFHRGGANADGSVDISDPAKIFRYLFLGGTSISCLDAADANDDGGLDVTDGIFMLGYLFQGGAAPPSPGPPGGICGIDPTDSDPLTCAAYNPVNCLIPIIIPGGLPGRQ